MENELHNASSPAATLGESLARLQQTWSRSPSAAGLTVGQRHPTLPDPTLAPAYATCRDIIRAHSKSFYLSARLLPAPKCMAVLALYALRRGVGIQEIDKPRSLHPRTAMQRIEAGVETFEAERREGVLPVECDHAGNGAMR